MLNKVSFLQPQTQPNPFCVNQYFVLCCPVLHRPIKRYYPRSNSDPVPCWRHSEHPIPAQLRPGASFINLIKRGSISTEMRWQVIATTANYFQRWPTSRSLASWKMKRSAGVFKITVPCILIVAGACDRSVTRPPSHSHSPDSPDDQDHHVSNVPYLMSRLPPTSNFIWAQNVYWAHV